MDGSVSRPDAAGRSAPEPGGLHYKWIALSNTTLGILMVTINTSILLIALPDIFTGIGIDPLQPGNTSYMLWLLMGFMVVTAVLVVSFGRIGDMYGRVKMYNLGFVVFTGFSILLSVTWMHGAAAAMWLIVMRIGQGIGGAFLFANSSAIVTDAFPENQRGLALGINNVAAIAGSFIGLVLGGLLGPVAWQLVFVVSVPFGLFGTVWAYLKLEERGVRVHASIDWWGNLTFAVGLITILVGITYGILPYGHHAMGWTNPAVLAALAGGAAVLAVFVVIETKVAHPMFHLPLFRIRAFAAGNVASLLASLGRGGMMFILVIWLQGIWLPLHGYSFVDTPLWAGIYMLPLTAGFLIAGPLSGYLSDHFGARPFATGGMVLAALSFLLLTFLPMDFSYVWFALLLLLNGLAMGLFASPNRAGIMNSLPPHQRGSGAGMVATFQNSAMVLSIGIFFTLVITGLASRLPSSMQRGLVAHGVPPSLASQVSHLPPTATVFSAFLGYNPVQQLLGPHLASLPAATVADITGRSFFPHLIAESFGSGLDQAFLFAMAAMLVAAVASWLRGGKYVYRDTEADEDEEGEEAPAGALGSATGVPGGATPVPGGATPVPGGATPVPGGATPVAAGATPVPGGATPVAAGAPGVGVARGAGAGPDAGAVPSRSGPAAAAPVGRTPEPGAAAVASGGAGGDGPGAAGPGRYRIRRSRRHRVGTG